MLVEQYLVIYDGYKFNNKTNTFMAPRKFRKVLK